MTALLVRADARQLPLPDESVDLILTSPPYWKLRDYRDRDGSLAGQIGSEPTPVEYLHSLWECTREWLRVLKPSGSIFVMLGDKYAQDTERSRNGEGSRQTTQAGGLTGAKSYLGGTVQLPKRDNGVPRKSLMLLPERYRIGCVDRLGLIARSVIEWNKPNSLPESVTDRVRRSHEDVVHLVRQPRYYSAVDEIREGYEGKPQRRLTPAPQVKAYRDQGISAGNLLRGREWDVPMAGANPLGKLPGSVWSIPTEPLVVPEHVAHARCCGGRRRDGCQDGLDHFAAWPLEWPRRLVLGWSPPGICVACGEGRRPVVDRKPMEWRPSPTLNGRSAPGTSRQTASGTMLAAAETRILGYACACTPYTDHPGTGERSPIESSRTLTTGRHGTPGQGSRPHQNPVGPWREHHFDRWAPPPTRPAVVLDPFGGTGASALVASVLGRVGITVDLSAGYCDLARWRTRDPGERARALRVDKPPPVPDAQLGLFEGVSP